MSGWPRGDTALAYQACTACGRIWYFRRPACPHCGHADPQERIASGRGTVYAATVVHRAPTRALQQHAPYAVLLVDADEGFRFMAHGARDAAIGDRVRLEFRTFDAAPVPFAVKDGPA